MSAHTPHKALIQALIVISILLMSACGWHLRGQVDLPEDQRSVHLAISNNARELRHELERAFTLNGVELTSADQAALLVSVSQLTEDRRVSSLGTDAVADSVSLSLLVTYSVADRDGKVIIPRGPARVGRSFTYDRDNVTAKSLEEQTIRREIQQELAQQILRNIRYSLNKQPAIPATNASE